MAERRPAHDLTAAKAACNTVTVTVGGLYLATHSVMATLVGTTASTVLTCWAMWSPYSRKQTLADREQSAAQSESHIAGHR